MERSGAAVVNPAKPAVGRIAKKEEEDLNTNGGAAPGSPASTPRGDRDTRDPPRTPESRSSSVVSSPSGRFSSPPVRDRRAANGPAGVEEACVGADEALKAGKAGDDDKAALMPPPPPAPPTTPKREGRRSTPGSRKPSKPRTPSALTALRLGRGEGDEEGGGDGEDEEEDDEKKLTPSKDKLRPNRALEMTPTKKSKGRLFGRGDGGSTWKDRITVIPSVSRVYGLVQKATGAIGGNGSDGAIYGELTSGCMQKVVNVLKERTGFDENSSFIDVGSGLGKPNFHVAQDPGCEISYGLELEEVRWQLSVVNHRRVLLDDGASGVEVKKHNVFFAHGDILSAKTFDPFTHVYMFDVGFPPDTLRSIAKMFNKSEARHLISYQFPNKVEEYGFEVDTVLKMGLQLTGSGEGHTMYLYRRKKVKEGLPIDRIMKVDPFFALGVGFCRDEEDGSALSDHVMARFAHNTSGGIRTRSRSRRSSTNA